MNNTFCGNDCERCRKKHQHSCPGCKEGGTFLSGDCPIVDCARAKGVEHCRDCRYQENCGTLSRSTDLYGCSRKTTALVGIGKWMTAMGVIRILQSLSNGVGDYIFQNSTAELISGGISIFCLLVMVGMLMVMKRYHEKYQTAARWFCGGIVLELATMIASAVCPEDLSDGWKLLLACATIIVLLVGMCRFWAVNSEILKPVDKKRSERWEKLGGWYILCNGTILLSVLLVYTMVPLIVAIALYMLWAGVIGMCVVSIVEVVMLFRTGAYFKQLRLKIDMPDTDHTV